MKRTRKRKASKRATRATKAERVAGVLLTHPDKPLWPAKAGKTAITKLDLARYLARCAPRMLPHVVGRPLSVVRVPNGIGGKRFFQRHPLEGAAAPMLEIKVRGAGSPFLGIANTRALVALAQAGVAEIHPWGSTKGNPDRPGQIVFDLDPAPRMSFDFVVETAHEIARRLRRCGLTPFVKTTGGKGLHVVVPVHGERGVPLKWRDAHAFAKAFCKALERDDPRHYTTNPLKAARSRKLLLDYMRNARAASAVAPWSPRARPGAPIAMPLSWKQVRPGLDPQRFTLAASASLLSRPDPWRGFLRTARSLPAAADRFARQQARAAQSR